MFPACRCTMEMIQNPKKKNRRLSEKELMGGD
jgi:hypothetical protein